MRAWFLDSELSTCLVCLMPSSAIETANIYCRIRNETDSKLYGKA